MQKKSDLADDWTRCRRIRNRCNKLVINSRNDYFTKLSSKIASESRGSKQYWNVIKSLMNYDSTDSWSIPPLQVDGDLICDNKEKAKIFNDFFCNQSDFDDTNIPTPNIFLRQQGSLGHIVITENEVEDILKLLDISVWTPVHGLRHISLDLCPWSKTYQFEYLFMVEDISLNTCSWSKTYQFEHLFMV